MPGKALYNDEMSRSEINYDKYLDAKGLNCPLPVLRAKVALNKMQPGEVLFVEATDSHAKIDFEAYCARTGHELLQYDDDSDVIKIRIKRVEKPNKI